MLLICTNVQISSKESASEDNIVHNPEIIVLFFFKTFIIVIQLFRAGDGSVVIDGFEGIGPVIVIHGPGHSFHCEPGRF